jgi:hypothetical protein
MLLQKYILEYKRYAGSWYVNWVKAECCDLLNPFHHLVFWSSRSKEEVIWALKGKSEINHYSLDIITVIYVCGKQMCYWVGMSLSLFLSTAYLVHPVTKLLFLLTSNDHRPIVRWITTDSETYVIWRNYLSILPLNHSTSSFILLDMYDP